MAKGIRSKVKRANRTALREAITIPLQIKRQEIIAKNIADGLKANNGSSIQRLKGLLSTTTTTTTTEGTAETTPAEATSAPAPKESVIVVKKSIGRRGNPNSKKQLEWFT